MGTVPENFHGVAGRSGRKSAYVEYNKISAINKLWEKINNKVLAGDELTEYEEKLVLALLPKTIKTETDITSDGKELKAITGINYITPDGNNIEANPEATPSISGVE